jgi:hypothetical protein
MTRYAEFLERKTQLEGGHGFEPEWMPDFLFDFQQSLVTWAIRQGRAAIFADCGLGKTPMQLVWADNVVRHTGRPVLIVTPLAVSFQTEGEAHKFGIDAAVSRDGTLPAPIVITNYERLHLFDRDKLGGLVCDESSAIKSFDGVRRQLVTDFMRKMRYRLLCTATAAPNDYIELGTSSEALGYLGHMDMLARFFTNKERSAKIRRPGRWNTQRDVDGFLMTDGWRFKGHAEEWFWRWVASWARAMRKPSDLGYPDTGFNLPPLNVRQHIVQAKVGREDTLFDLPALGLREEREESRRTVIERCELAADLIADAPSAVAWCQLNTEGDTLTRLIDGAVQISGSDTADRKEDALIAFSKGDIRVLVTKPVIGAWGLNWQHCNRMTFFPSHSYEQYYQAVRRSWRFGQKHPVTVDLVSTEGGSNALRNLRRKSDQADRMFESLVAHMLEAIDIARANHFHTPTEVPAWATC